MANTQTVDSLNRLELLLCSSTQISGKPCIALLDRVLKNCGCFNRRKSFPCLQDQSVILFLLRVSHKRPDVCEYLFPYLENILEVIAEYMDQADATDWEFLSSFFMYMIKIHCCTQGVLDILAKHYGERDDDSTAVLYWEVSKQAVDSSDVTADSSLYTPKKLAALIELVSYVITDEVKSTSVETTTACYALAASLLSHPALLLVKHSSNSLLLPRQGGDRIDDLVAMVAGCALRILTGEPVKDKDDSEASEYRAPLVQDESTGVTLVPPAGTVSGNVQNPPNRQLAITCSVALLACAQIKTEYLQRAFQTGFQLLHQLTDERPLSLQDVVLHMKTITLLIFDYQANRRAIYRHPPASMTQGESRNQMQPLSAPEMLSSVIGIISDVVVYLFVQGLHHTLRPRQQCSTTGGSHSLSSLLDPVMRHSSAKLSVSVLWYPSTAQHIYDAGIKNSHGPRIPMPTLGLIEAVMIFVDCGLKECHVVGWDKCRLKGSIQSILESVCAELISLEDSKCGAHQSSDTLSVSMSSKASSSARVVRIMGLLEMIFDCACMICRSSMPDTDKNDDITFKLAQLIYPTLLDLLSLNVWNSFSVVRSLCQLLAKVSARHDKEFLDKTVDSLCCSYARSFALCLRSENEALGTTSPQTSQESARKKSASIQILYGLGIGMTCLVQTQCFHYTSQISQPIQPLHIRYSIVLGIFNALLDLFVNLANDSLAVAIQSALKHKCSIATQLRSDDTNCTIGLVCILPAIARSMEYMSSFRSKCENAATMETGVQSLSFNIPMLRNMWIHLSLLQLTNTSIWSSKQLAIPSVNTFTQDDVIDSIVTIAKHTPPLVEYKGGGALKFMELELANTTVSKSALKCTPSAKVNGGLQWVDGCTGYYLLKDLPGSASSVVRGNVGILLYLSAIRYLESLRITELGDGRMVFYYLCDDGILSSEPLRASVLHIARYHLLSAWEGKTIMQKPQKHISAAASLSDSMKLDTIKLYQFVVSRCIHSNRCIRELAFAYVRHMGTTCPWLQWDAECIFTLLQCVEIMTALGMKRDMPNLPYLVSEPWHIDGFLNPLPPTEFPGKYGDIAEIVHGNCSEISDTTYKLLVLVYEWLFRAINKAPSIVTSILQEYMLQADCESTSQNRRRHTVVSISICSELCTSRRPYFHIDCTGDTDIFAVQRKRACAWVSHNLSTESDLKTTSPFFSYSATSLAIKSKYIGEARGLLDANHTKSMALQFIDTQSPTTNKFPVAESLLEDMYLTFRNATSPYCENICMEDLETLILRSGAILHEMAISIDKKSETMRTQLARGISRVRCHAMTLFRWYKDTLRLYYCDDLIACLVFVWRWLGCTSALLTPLVIHNSLSCFRKSAFLNIGIFHCHTSSCPSGIELSDLRACNTKLLAVSAQSGSLSGTVKASSCLSDVSGHERWLDYLTECLSAYSDYAPAVFGTVEAVLNDKDICSSDSQSMYARFKLLCLALRLLKDSLIRSTDFNVSSARRRIMRERVIYLAFQAFVGTTPAPTRDADKEFLVMKEFIEMTIEDSKLWAVEYAENSPAEDHGSHSTSCGGTINAEKSYIRGPGAHHAVKYLRVLMRCRKSADDLRHQYHHKHHHSVASLKDLGILVSGTDESMDSTHQSCMILWLLHAFIVHHMHRIRAWKGNKAELSTAALAFADRKFYEVHNASEDHYRSAVRVAWAIDPKLAISFLERFQHRIVKNSSSGQHNLVLAEFVELVNANPNSVRNDWRAIPFISLIEDSSRRGIIPELCHWAVAPVHVAVNLILRCPVTYFYSHKKPNPSILHSNPLVLQYIIRSLRRQKDLLISTLQFYLPQFVQLLRRDLFGVVGDFICELATSSTLLCHQLMWLLQLESVDENDHIQNSGGQKGKNKRLPTLRVRHGYCRSLHGRDNLPNIASEVLKRTRKLLSPEARVYLDQECEFFNKVTNISAKLKKVKNKNKHNALIKVCLVELGLPGNLYLPTDPFKKVTEIVVDSGSPMQSAAKCPYLLVFKTIPWGGPDSMHSGLCTTPGVEITPMVSKDILSAEELELKVRSYNGALSPSNSVSNMRKGIGKLDSANFRSPKVLRSVLSADVDDKSASSYDLASPSFSDMEESKQADELEYDSATRSVEYIRTNGVGSGSTHSDNVSEDDHTLSSETEYKSLEPKDDSFSDKRIGKQVTNVTSDLRRKMTRSWASFRDIKLSQPHIRHMHPFRASTLVRKHTPYPTHNASESEGLDACIFKVYDDCRQDALTIQVIRILKDAYAAVNLPLYLVPYSIVPNRTGDDMAQGGILQVVANVKSRDQLGKEGAKTLKQHFMNRFGPESCAQYKQAQMEFARSLAGYAVVCYLLGIKDRHNGNILIDKWGHLIHIDFGFLLGISPGGNLGFENAAFKLSKEMIEILGGIGSDEFEVFVNLTVRGFLVARDVQDAIVIVISSMMDSGLPCFMHRNDNIENLTARFFPNCSDGEAASLMRKLIFDAANKWTTVAYDGIQKLQNNIYSDAWM